MTKRNTGRPDAGPPPTDFDAAAFQTATVSQWLAYWLENVMRRDATQSTYNRYRSILHLHIDPLIGDLPASELTARHILQMQDTIVANGLSPSTVGLARNIISGGYRVAIRMELTALNPMQAARAPRATQREIMPPDVAVVRALLDVAETQDNACFALFHVLVYTGMRRGEAIALRWANVDLDAGYLRVTESAVRQPGQSTVVGRPKTQSSIRAIDLDALTIDVLSRHRQRLSALFGEVPALVFPHSDGGRLRPTTVARALKRLGAEVGAPSITFHQLRHFHASVALQQKQNIKVVSQRLGHASVMTTLDTYSHVLAGWQSELADSFAQALRPEDRPAPTLGAGPQPLAAVAYGDGYCRGIEVAHQEMRDWRRDSHSDDCECVRCITIEHIFKRWSELMIETLDRVEEQRRRDGLDTD